MFLSPYPDLRLPVEVCEQVIEIAGLPPRSGAFNPRSHYSTLRSCALVCSDWLPRSQLMLYFRVHLASDTDASLFVRTLRERPFLASLVRKVDIEGFRQLHTGNLSPYHRSSYISFIQGCLLRHLNHMDTLNLYNLDFSHEYPPITPSLITQFPVQHLTLWNCSLPLTTVFRIIWSLDDLRSLSLSHDNLGLHASTISAIECQRLYIMHLRRAHRCGQLRTLTLGGLYLRSEHFPPPGVFGSHVTQLNLCLRLGQTEGYLGGHETRPMNPFPVLGLHSHFVSSLSALEGVHISMALSATKEIPAGFYESYAAFNSCILPSLGNMKSLRVLSFTLLDCLNPWGRPSLPDIARLLFYDGMQEQLNAVPYHTRIKVVVEDIMPVDTLRIDQWLELAHLRLPGCHDRLSIHICGVAHPGPLSVYPSPVTMQDVGLESLWLYRPVKQHISP